MIWLIGIVIGLICFWLFHSLRSNGNEWFATIQQRSLQIKARRYFTILSALICILLFLVSVWLAVLVFRGGVGISHN